MRGNTHAVNWAATSNVLRPREMLHEPTPAFSKLIDVEAPDDDATGMIGAYLDAARLMGRRTAELHLALASRPGQHRVHPGGVFTFVASARSRTNRCATSPEEHALRRLNVKRRSLDEASAPIARTNPGAPEHIESRFVAFLKTEDVGEAHSLSWQLASRTNSVHGQRLLDYRFSRRACSAVERPASQAYGDPRPRDDATIVSSERRMASSQNQTRGGGGAIVVISPRWSDGLGMWQISASRAFLNEYLAVADRAAFVPQAPERTDGDARSADPRTRD